MGPSWEGDRGFHKGAGWTWSDVLNWTPASMATRLHLPRLETDGEYCTRGSQGLPYRIGTKDQVHWLLPVVVHQHIDEIPEAARVSRREEAAAELVDGLSQLRNALVVFPSIVPMPERRARCSRLRTARASPTPRATFSWQWKVRAFPQQQLSGEYQGLHPAPRVTDCPRLAKAAK